jgi:nickel-dependent lactate racemase
MQSIGIGYGLNKIYLDFPENSIIYQSNYQTASDNPEKLLMSSLAFPVGSPSLESKLAGRREGKVVVVVSDFTRPIPYVEFLPELLGILIQNGVKREEIQIIVATGMHRPTTSAEKLKMFGDEIVNHYTIIDHNAEDDARLIELDGKSWSGEKVRLNKYYVEAGFRILTGLVEPHFMAGFSGGRKTICPGLSSLDAIKKFHGYEFLNHPNASNTVLENNPCHNENSSVARICPSDFLINIILDQQKKINAIISGDQVLSHNKAIEYVKERSCIKVTELSDMAITSCGGYPLDNTFYQCVKGFVNTLPALKNMGELFALGRCSEGIGSTEYEGIMKKYSNNYSQFLEDIKNNRFFIKDQWQLQMHLRVLNKTGTGNLHFLTSGIPAEELTLMGVTPHSIEDSEIVEFIQSRINQAQEKGERIAVFPEGPYCSPVPG